MTSRSNKMLVGSDLDQEEDWSKVHIELGRPTHIPFDNIVSLLFKIGVTRDNRR